MKRFLLIFAMCSLATGSLKAADDFGILIFNHQIAIGMSYGNVQAAWGKPRKVDRSTSSYGVTEYWFFSNGYMVVFENGRVVSFHQ